jgi:outer membrane cobalamin receptor
MRYLGIGLVLLAAASQTRAGDPATHDIVITATRTEQSITDVAASIEVIDRTQIVSSGAHSVDELFKNTIGVDLQGSGLPGSAVRLGMRGLTQGYQSERVLVLVDGRRINDAYIGNAELAMLPADNIERVEVLRGPASALYGSNAEGGVINVITRHGTTTPVTEIKTAAGTHATQIHRLSHGWQIGNLDYFVTVSHHQTDGYTDNSDGTDRDWAADNFTGNIGYHPDAQSELRTQVGAYSGEGTDENSDREVDKNYQSIQYENDWDPKREALFSIGAFRNGQRDIYNWKYPGEGDYRQQTLGWDLQQSIWVTDEHYATAGIEQRRDDVDIDEVTGPVVESADTSSGYLQDEFYIAPPLRLTIGVRSDDDSDFGNEISPRVAALWHAQEGLDVFASVNKAYRAPALSDRYANVEYNGMNFVGNPDLRPETMMAYELGARGRPVNGLTLDAALFHNNMKDSFDFLMTEPGIFRNENATDAWSQGAEVGAEWTLNDIVSLFANYSFTDGEYDAFPSFPGVEGNQLAYLARNKASAGASLRHGDRAQTSIATRYVGARYGDPQNTAASEMEAYLTVDAHIRLRMIRQFYATLDVSNLLDEDYQEYPGVHQAGTVVLGGVEAAF